MASGFNNSSISGGKTDSVIREAAKGAIVFTKIFLRSPSFAKHCVNPCNANLANHISIHKTDSSFDLNDVNNKKKKKKVTGTIIGLTKVSINASR